MTTSAMSILPMFPDLGSARILHVPGWPGYAITDDGRPFTCKLRGSQVGSFGSVWRPLKPHLNGRGYAAIHLCHSGRPFLKGLLHRLVMLAFAGPCPDGMQVCHNDGNKVNNRLSNLRYDTPKNNQADRIVHGTMLCGERCPTSKLTADDVREIRRRAEAGERHLDIANDYGIRDCQVSRIKKRLRWAHLDLESGRPDSVIG